MTDHPYLSRAMQVAQHLRTRILKGEWRDRLPGERLLAQELGVGRRTLRAALNQLAAEKLLEPQGERRERRLLRREENDAPVPQPQKVGLLLISPISNLNRSSILLIDELRAFFIQRNISLHLHDLTTSPKQSILHYFRYLYKTLGYNAWLLFGSNQELQAWCEKKKLPVILASAAFPGVALTGVEIAYRAACSHAVGQMVQAGHRHLACLLPKLAENVAPGDRASRVGFLEGVAALKHLGVHGSVESFPKERVALFRFVDQLLARTPRPTAWLIRMPYFLTIMVRLLQIGVKIPDDVALVSRDSEDLFQHLPIAPSCYAVSVEAKARQLGLLTMRLLNGESLPPICFEVMPEWVHGQTLGLRITETSC